MRVLDDSLSQRSGKYEAKDDRYLEAVRDVPDGKLQ